VRHIHASPQLRHAKRQDLFTPSPFERFSRINIDDKFSVHRDLKEGPTNVYGIRRYLLLPRVEDVATRDDGYSEGSIVASLNANRNVLFGARLHVVRPEEGDVDDDDYESSFLAACGALLDIAKEDASVNGQQVQALATLNGMCSWVEQCLDRDGEGSDVLTGLMHGTQPNELQGKKTGERPPPGKRSGQTVRNASAGLVLKKESDRIQMLEAVRAIATGAPRPGHSVVGAGTYRDGQMGWTALAREYARLATNDDGAMGLDASYVGRRGLEEVALYRSREGEVTKIEHLAHTEPGYLREAGGAMARLYFV